MIIKTKFLGEVDIREEDILVFPDGILGFEESRKFILLPIPENEFFTILQDVEREYVSFIVTDPWKFKADYEMEVPDNELLKINIRKKEQIAMLNIVTLSDVFENSTMNLLAPVILNTENRIGKQYVLNNVRYSSKHPLFEKNGESENVDS
ncbi:flagellar assembly protein FliW [Proteiniclasticum sp. SCR006]|jgi:flagellar assembly factor FliW|uniref:Flagellar assembly factor FliW n=1 Tax=Proteiniclasticum aestuarii TaxID=2817862 RepID=A0A939KL62_9CLOT|nr:flagellar assembly protein FliW [Proteiniclasticum aestuarii]MBO1265350.1 flagellar assembly protein FliW [Proteiniclasticum aestuarii]